MPLVRCRFLPQPHLGENNQQITVKIDIIKGSFASNHFTALLGFITSNNQTTIFLLCGCCFSIPSLSENCSRSVFIAQKSLKHAFLPKLIPPNSGPHVYTITITIISSTMISKVTSETKKNQPQQSQTDRVTADNNRPNCMPSIAGIKTVLN